MNLLSVEENISFESHILSCSHCQERIEDEMNSLLALRRATQARQALAKQGAQAHFAYAL